MVFTCVSFDLEIFGKMRLICTFFRWFLIFLNLKPILSGSSFSNEWFWVLALGLNRPDYGVPPKLGGDSPQQINWLVILVPLDRPKHRNAETQGQASPGEKNRNTQSFFFGRMNCCLSNHLLIYLLGFLFKINMH